MNEILSNINPIFIIPLIIIIGQIFFRPHIAIYFITFILFVSPVLSEDSGFTLNRLVGLIALIGTIYHKVRKNNISIPPAGLHNSFIFLIFLYLLLIGLSVIANGLYPSTISYTFDTIVGVVIGWLVLQNINEDKQIEKILIGMIVANIIVAIDFYISVSSYAGLLDTRFLNYTESVNKVSIQLAISIIAIIYLNISKWINSFFSFFLKTGPVIILIGAMFLTGSRSAFICLLVALSFIVFYSKGITFRFKAISISIFIFISSFFLFDIIPYSISRIFSVFTFDFNTIQDFDDKRFGLYETGLKIFFSNPILGVGFGGYPYNISNYSDWTSKTSPHSLYIGTLSELGLMGFIVLIIIVYKILSYLLTFIAYNDNIFCILLILIIHFVDGFFHGNYIHRQLFIFIALGIRASDIIQFRINNGMLSKT